MASPLIRHAKMGLGSIYSAAGKLWSTSSAADDLRHFPTARIHLPTGYTVRGNCGSVGRTRVSVSRLCGSDARSKWCIVRDPVSLMRWFLRPCLFLSAELSPTMLFWKLEGRPYWAAWKWPQNPPHWRKMYLVIYRSVCACCVHTNRDHFPFYSRLIYWLWEALR